MSRQVAKPISAELVTVNRTHPLPEYACVFKNLGGPRAGNMAQQVR